MRDVLRFAGPVAEGADVQWSADKLAVHGETDATRLLRSHAGRLVILDGAANVEELRVFRPDLHVERLDVVDAGDAPRVLLFAPHANRTALRNGRGRGLSMDALTSKSSSKDRVYPGEGNAGSDVSSARADDAVRAQPMPSQVAEACVVGSSLNPKNKTPPDDVARCVSGDVAPQRFRGRSALGAGELADPWLRKPPKESLRATPSFTRYSATCPQTTRPRMLPLRTTCLPFSRA